MIKIGGWAVLKKLTNKYGPSNILYRKICYKKSLKILDNLEGDLRKISGMISCYLDTILGCLSTLAPGRGRVAVGTENKANPARLD